MTDRKLGKGLDFLIRRSSPPPAATPQEAPPLGVQTIAVDAIRPNPYQPRRTFDIPELNDLIESVRLHGVLQPIAVRKTADGYELIAGERRWRACQELGIAEIPAQVRATEDQQMLELALIENILRADLDPIERAKAYRRLMDDFALTQEEAAKRLSQKRSTVANYLRLLELPKDVREALKGGKLTMGHARALAGLEEPVRQRRWAREVTERGLSVRDLERELQAERARGGAPGQAPGRGPGVRNPQEVEIESRLREAFGVEVRVNLLKKGGKVSLRISDPRGFQHLLDVAEAGAEQVRSRYAEEGSAEA